MSTSKPEIIKVLTALCSNCGSGNAGYRCGGCAGAAFCSKDCQKANWKEHKEVCSRNNTKKPKVEGGSFKFAAAAAEDSLSVVVDLSSGKWLCGHIEPYADVDRN